MTFLNRYIFAFSLATFLVSCNEAKQEPITAEENPTDVYIKEVQGEYVPDRRVARFDVTGEEYEGKFVLRGETTNPEALARLKEKLDSARIEYVDSIQVYPAKDLEGKTNALVRISVANIRSNPKHSAELATQATLGTPLKVLKKEGEWYLVQTPDKYLAWVDHGGVTLLSDEELKNWKASEKVIFTEPFGQVYEQASENSGTVSDAVAGNIFELKGVKNGFFEVEYPDARTGFIKTSEAENYSDWLNHLEASEENLVETSKKLMGLPYLWGGTSAKGVDCSGYTKTVFFMNGMIIPRDASQQVQTGALVDDKKKFENLQPGDLLFFGTPATDTTKEKVVHVGMWIGNNEFIHSSGRVHVSSVDSTATNFDEFNLNRYLRTKRLLGEEEDPNLLLLKQSELFTASPSKG
ncbi:C40 family peptidase [Salinimicrobium sp. TH3]|uniref:C40 family peptidase n=1 Tax=Salinimicrobium sp. TH3 TaxID=2997342 RepID=UPI0022739723|nr:SH3 domain-containing C40 family peptidase [Salinimicrobium sp. TH3]MCY2686502.1 SH3 domain-containing C40 family peptidase [Salinimicrobium sp. TH3]